MKKLYKNIKLTSFLLTLLAFNIAAGPVAVVNSVSGGAFGTLNGKTKQLRAGDHLSDFSEVFTEVGAQVSISDYFDHRYHLSGSGHIRFLNKTIELKGGYLWVQSYQENYNFMVQTANAQSSFKKGEAIISFDALTGKSQILVVKGSFSFGNILEQYLKTDVDEGKFSFLHKDYENGAPRNPTPIGFDSFKKVTALFNGVKPAGEKKKEAPVYHRPAYGKAVATNSNPVLHRAPFGSVEYSPNNTGLKKREVASVSSGFDIIDHAKNNLPSEPSKYAPSATENHNQVSSTHKKDGIIYLIEDKAEKKEKRRDVASFYEEKIKKMMNPKKKKFRPDYTKKSNVKVQVFGAKQNTAKKVNTFRVPSSVEKKPRKRSIVRTPASVGGMVPTIKSNSFEGSLSKEYKKQMRHKNEVNSLIDALKSYDQDYSKSY